MADMDGMDRLSEFRRRLVEVGDDPEELTKFLADLAGEASQLGRESAALWQLHAALLKLRPEAEEAE